MQAWENVAVLVTGDLPARLEPQRFTGLSASFGPAVPLLSALLMAPAGVLSRSSRPPLTLAARLASRPVGSDR